MLKHINLVGNELELGMCSKKLIEQKLELLIFGSACLQLGEVLVHAKGKIKGKILIIGPIGGGKYYTGLVSSIVSGYIFGTTLCFST